VLLNISIF